MGSRGSTPEPMMEELDGIWRGPAASVLELRGADRARFLNGLVTCDVKALPEGRAAYGFVTSLQGKVVADVVVVALSERLVLLLPQNLGDTIEAHLRRYLIADRVEMTALPGATMLTWVGAAATTGGETSDVSAAPVQWSVLSSFRGGEFALCHGRLGVPALSVLYGQEGEADRAARAALEANPSLVAISDHEMEEARVRAGIARFGIDFDARHFPQETGAEEQAVSYTKGCYLGQEIVARLHYRGQPQNQLVRLQVEPAVPDFDRSALRGAALMAEGKESGRLTSVVAARSAGQPALGLAVLHRRALGQALEVVLDGGEVAGVARPLG